MSDLIHQIAHRGTKHEPQAPTLEMDSVCATYPSADTPFFEAGEFAVENITFHAECGEQIAVIGPNGAGKSTLFKLTTGLLKPDRGEVRMYGRAPDEHICIAYVPQRSQIDWSFPATVADVVMMGRTRQIGLFRWPSRQDRAVVQACLERVNAWHLAKKQIGELSGGQQQRVFIARALAQETDLLLLDEPLTGLDIPSQEVIFDILARLRPDGVTVLVATHDLNLAAERFDKVMLLNTEIIAFGPASAVLTTENLRAAYGRNSA